MPEERVRKRKGGLKARLATVYGRADQSRPNRVCHIMNAPAAVSTIHRTFCHDVLAVPLAIIENWMSTKSGEIQFTRDTASSALCTFTRKLVLSTAIVVVNSR